MSGSRFAVFLLAMACATPAPGVEVLESLFQVSYQHAGKDYVYNESIVPLLPGNSCYHWYLRVDQNDAAVTATETLELPAAIEWGTTGTKPDDATQIKQGGKVAVTTLNSTSDSDGWISHGWCSAEGDPTGPHSIEVAIDDATVARFDFEVVDPANYTFPIPPKPDPMARSANNVW